MWNNWSLRRKLLGLVLMVMVGAGLGLVSVVMVTAERERRSEGLRSARAVSSAIHHTLRSAMLSGDRDILRAAAITLADQPAVISVSVYDAEGRRRVHAGARQDVTISPLDIGAHPSVSPVDTQAGESSYAVLSPVRSESQCGRCHGEQVTLGFIAAVVSTAAEEQRIHALRNRLLWGGLCLLAITCLSLYLGVRRWVQHPLTALTAAVDALRAPDAASFAPAAGDEFARLSASFDAMVAEISAKRDALLAAERRLAQSHHLASIGLLAAGIAHEISGPLGAVQLHASYWRERGAGPVRDAAAAVVEAAERVGQLQRELLTFDRREALHLTRCDLRALTQACLRRVEQPGLTCKFEGPEQPLAVNADETLLARALGNVVTNATQAMSNAGKLTLSVRAADSARAEIIIADTGPGIVADDLPHIFDPFFTRKPRARGSGLGLAVAREIIVRHGGEIAAETTANGARFRILVPLARPEEPGGPDPNC